MNIVFMGTPEFAVPVLKAIMQVHRVVAVVTAPDKKAGRGHKLQMSAVKVFALSQELYILQPLNLKSNRFIQSLIQLNADLFIVVAFRMLPESVWSIPKFGTFNLHASLLPKYRGAAPIQRAIMAGEHMTGLTMFKLTAEIDTGDIIAQIEIPIGADETGGSLHDRMMEISGDFILSGIDKLINPEIDIIKQDHHKATLAPKIFKEDCEIKWDRHIDIVYNHIRALIPYPGPWFRFNDITYKILGCTKIMCVHDQLPGTPLIESKTLWICCPGGYINILQIQPEGKRVMTALEFLNGNSFNL
jgi:methionyl-tRNA formyltransferase